MIDHKQVESLLSKLCIEMGFCLPPSEHQRLVDAPPQDVRAFTDAVFVAEGMNPEMADRHLYRQVRDAVAQAFRTAEDAVIQQALRR